MPSATLANGRSNAVATHLPVFSLPWRMFVAPGFTWSQVGVAGRTAVISALAWQLGAVVLGRLLSANAMHELDGATQSVALGAWNWAAFGVTLLAVLVLCLAGNFALSAALFGASLLCGARITLRQALCLASYGLLPFALGDMLSRWAFGMIQPLAFDTAAAFAAHLKPFSLGVLTLWPSASPALSIGWFFAAFCDAFGLWSLVIIWIGLREFCRLSTGNSRWVLLTLVLILASSLAAAWQVAQQALLRAAL